MYDNGYSVSLLFDSIESCSTMDKRVIKQRARAKQRQLRMRRRMRLVGCVGGTILAVVLLFNLIISPLARRIFGDGGKGTVEVQAQVPEENSSLAVRVPVKDQANASKATSRTAGWQEDANGRWYQNADGTYYANGLLEIDGDTYYVDENGYMQTGWITVDDEDCMFDENGILDPTRKQEMIALTFDDGPGQYTMELLNCLEEYGAHATFFMQGINAQNYPDEIKKMQEIGCELGNHSYDHPQLTYMDLADVTRQFTRTNDIIEEACGSPATVARCPYGAQDDNILEAVGMPCFMWDVDTLDWSTMNADSTYNETLKNAKDGSIVLMHDIHEPSVEAAKRIIPALIEKGYKLVTVSELAKAKGVTLQNGRSYTDFCAGTDAEGAGSDDSSYEDGDNNGDSYDEDSTDYDEDSTIRIMRKEREEV